MKTKIFTIVNVLFFAIHVLQVSAQEVTTPPYKDGFLKRLAISAKIGSYGPGIDIHAPLFSNLKARVGFNYLGYAYTKPIDFDANPPMSEQSTVSGCIEQLDLKFANMNLLFDFYPVKSGIFCLTAGTYIGNNKISAHGIADEPFVWNNQIINVVGGSFDTYLKMGNVFKPYAGIGLGRTISKSRVSFRFDLGVIYQGGYTIKNHYNYKEYNGIIELDESSSDLPFSNDLLKWWPLLSFSISYRII